MAEEQTAETEIDAGGDEAPDFSRLSVGETLRHAVKEATDRAAGKADTALAEDKAGGAADAGRQRDERGRFAPKDGDLPVKEVIDSSKAVADTNPAKTTGVTEATTSPQAAAATTATAPTSWSKDMHADWTALPPKVQDYIRLREQQSQDGVQQLKHGYAELDAAIAPYKQMIAGYGQTPGHTIRQLFEWNAALAGPYKEQAFEQLAQRFGIDLTRYSPQRQTPAATEGGQQGIQNPIEPVVQQLQAWQRGIEQQLISQQESVRQQEVRKAMIELQAWAADKPHFAQVRGTMQHLVGLDQAAINSGAEPPYGLMRPNGSVDLDRAYQKAIVLDDGLSAQVRAAELAAHQEKTRAEEAARVAQKALKDREALQRAKRAGVSLPPGSQTGPAGQASKAPPAGERVRDTILRSLKEAQG
jgi:hypothetical protein